MPPLPRTRSILCRGLPSAPSFKERSEVICTLLSSSLGDQPSQPELSMAAARRWERDVREREPLFPASEILLHGSLLLPSILGVCLLQKILFFKVLLIPFLTQKIILDCSRQRKLLLSPNCILSLRFSLRSGPGKASGFPFSITEQRTNCSHTPGRASNPDPKYRRFGIPFLCLSEKGLRTWRKMPPH